MEGSNRYKHIFTVLFSVSTDYPTLWVCYMGAHYIQDPVLWVWVLGGPKIDIYLDFT